LGNKKNKEGLIGLSRLGIGKMWVSGKTSGSNTARKGIETAREKSSVISTG